MERTVLGSARQPSPYQQLIAVYEKDQRANGTVIGWWNHRMKNLGTTLQKRFILIKYSLNLTFGDEREAEFCAW